MIPVWFSSRNCLKPIPRTPYRMLLQGFVHNFLQGFFRNLTIDSYRNFSKDLYRRLILEGDILEFDYGFFQGFQHKFSFRIAQAQTQDSLRILPEWILQKFIHRIHLDFLQGFSHEFRIWRELYESLKIFFPNSLIYE